ncbi:MAG: hypothetical protein J5710_03625 [Treponema sp.]|nr:hypothetical protein [Treponema sp.]
MKIITKIESIKDWKRVYPPAGKDKQWKDCYSAKEFAKIVTDSYKDISFEEDLRNKLHFNNSFHLLPEETYPEHLSAFDNNFRGKRHHDLACIAKMDNKRMALWFEAKVNESLDKQLFKYLDSKGKKERVDAILKSFFKTEYKNEMHGNIYYQILSAIAGSIAFAYENAANDVYFILYQIEPEKNNQVKNVEKNMNALNDFISLFGIKERIDPDNNTVCLGDLSIERHLYDENRDLGQMHANVSVAFVEKEVTGESID